MRRLLAVSAAFLIGIGLGAAAHADGMPELTKHKTKIVRHVHRVHARHRIVRSAIVGLVGPYDLHGYPPPPTDSAYQPAMVEYFRDVSVTGYRPASAAGYVIESAADYVGGVYYHRTGWPGYQGARVPRPVQIDNFPFRHYAGADVLEYDGAIGEYVKLSSVDAAAAIQVSQDKPLPLLPVPPR